MMFQTLKGCAVCGLVVAIAVFSGGCGQATPCTWRQIVAAFPAAKVREATNFRGSFGVNQGSFNAGIVANADALYLSLEGDRTAFDFEK